MEEQVKARLIGATVLVVIAVALVPELLSGPRRHGDDDAEVAGKRGTRTYTIDLSAGAGEGRAEPLPKPSADARNDSTRLPTVAPPGQAAAAQVAEPPAAAAPVETVAAAARAPGAEPVDTPTPATAKPAVAPVVAQGGWAVQVGAFGSAATARKLVADLARDGFTAYVSPLTRSGKTLHRVRVGPQPSRADAEQLAARLKGKGLPGAVVAAD
jgi:cell division septation protein DedD